ncbi:MAG: anti-sigma factor [Stellaceae bacterium]
MKYDDPKLRELLAGRYVLGTMQRRARARFDRLIAAEPSFCTEVRQWAEIFSPIDEAEVPEAPPQQVWEAIEGRLGPITATAPARPRRPWFDSLRLWQATTALAIGVAILLAVLLGTRLSPELSPAARPMVAILSGSDGIPAWLVQAGAAPGRVTVSALAPQPLSPGHSFELWAIAGHGAPRPLGIVPPQPRHPLVLAASAVPARGGVLAISLEPKGGSPTGKPTGPVLYKGKIFTDLE